MSSFTRNEKRYRELSAPLPKDEVNANISAFYDELGALREKHKIADCVVITGVVVDYGDDKEGHALTWMSYGDKAKVEGMTAFAYGQAAAERRETMNLILAGDMLKKEGR